MSTRFKLVIYVLVFTGIVLAAGLNSPVYLGDEVIHYRFARGIFQTGERLAFDPTYESGHPPGYFYIAGPFWHFLLVCIWKLAGGVSSVIAQAYQACYYALLMILTFLLGRFLYDEKTALASSVIVATVPMMASLSIIFYIDVPATVFMVLFLLLFFKKRYWLAGFSIALMYYTKRNACFIVPVMMVMMLFEHRKDLIKALRILIKLTVPAMAVIGWDVVWRLNNMGSFFGQPRGPITMPPVDMGALGLREEFMKDFLQSGQFNASGNQASALIDPVDIVKYLGIVLLVLCLSYFIRRTFKRNDIRLWIPIIGYMVVFFFFFGLRADIRYLTPIVPLLSIIAARYFVSVKRPFFRNCIVGICVLQLISCCGYVYARRQITREETQAFKYISENVQDDKLVMYLEPILLDSTGKRAVWGTYYLWPYLFWGTDEEKKTTIEFNDLGYIVIKKTRVYDDTHTKHMGGYPRSFVDKLPNLDFVELVCENDLISVWKINRDLTKPTVVEGKDED